MQLRTIAASLAAAAAAGSLVLTAAPVHAAGTASPMAAAQTWLVDQLQDGLLPASYGGANYGASADALVSLVMIGDTTDATTIANALAAHIDDYISGDATGDPGSTYAGSVAKAAVALQAAGLDPTSVDGENLITRLEGQVQASGRIQDTSAFGDYATVLGQAFAVNALTQAGSSKAAAATTFLLSQQCSAGWFRQSFDQTTDASKNQVGTDETCDADTASTPSVDATATALMELAPQVDAGTASAAVTSAVAKAKAWLLSVQQKDGGWNDGGAGDPENANSTGLAGIALARLDPTNPQPAGSAAAATWLRARQLENVGKCTPYAKADLGAIAYDPTAWTKAQTTPVGTANDQFIVAASQAMALLGAAPVAATTPSFSGSGSGSFAKAGSKRTFEVTGLGGPTPACVSDSRSTVLLPGDTTGVAKAALTMRATTGTETITLTSASGATARTTRTVLAAKRLKVTAPKTVRAGRSLRVKVTGLAKSERVTIKVRGKRVASGIARGTTFTKAVTVRGKKGRVAIAVIGEYANRKGSATVTVK